MSLQYYPRKLYLGVGVDVAIRDSKKETGKNKTTITSILYHFVLTSNQRQHRES
jgi:hypothetical protein